MLVRLEGGGEPPESARARSESWCGMIGRLEGGGEK
jgi:hypothetical protein